MPSKTPHLVFVYAAGPGGAWLYGYLMKKDHLGWVLAPSSIPTKAGDRVHTDHRDAMPRASPMRSGGLTAVYVPQEDDEAMRDLTRARDEALRALTAATFRLKAFLLRPESRDTGRAHGGPAPLRWL